MHNKNPQSNVLRNETFTLTQNQSLLVLFTILIVAFFLRVWDLSNNPPGFFCDEASVGYDAYLLLTSGVDSSGARWPLFFRSFDIYRGPLEVYFTMPFVWVFGLNEFAVRFTSVFFSLLSIIVLFAIGKKLRGNLMGLFLAGSFAITPWSIHLSRTGFTAQNISIFFVLASLVLWLHFKEKQSFKWLFLFSAVLGVSAYGYFSARIIVPLLFLFFLSFLILERKFRFAFFMALIFFVLSAPLLQHTFSGQGFMRGDQVGLFSFTPSQGIESPLEKFVRSYVLHFSPSYLTLKGDTGMNNLGITRHSLEGLGQFFIWQGGLLVAGLYFAFKKKVSMRWLFLFLLLIYPIPSSLSSDIAPQATRSILGLVPLTYFIAYGAYYLIQIGRKYTPTTRELLALGAVVAVVGSLAHYGVLLSKYKLNASDWYGWQFGARETVAFFIDQKNNYDELLLSSLFNESHIFLKFYDPENKCTNCRIGDLSNFDGTRKQLFAVRPHELEPASFEIPAGYHFKTLQEVRSYNGDVELLIGTLVKDKESL